MDGPPVSGLKRLGGSYEDFIAIVTILVPTLKEIVLSALQQRKKT